jgi:hypothetical protein
MKAAIIEKGNQATFKMYPKIVHKTMIKEDKHSHLLPVNSKNPQVIFDASTKGDPHEVVLNEITTA